LSPAQATEVVLSRFRPQVRSGSLGCQAAPLELLSQTFSAIRQPLPIKFE
jgi:hypothetical protein